MANRIIKFDRWKNYEKKTWSYQVFSKYDDQLGMMVTSSVNATKYCYKSMRTSGAKWVDPAAQVLATGDKYLSAFSNLKHWSDVYNDYNNWMRLNVVLACAANLESYMAGVIDTALKSNPGILFGATHALDGAKLLKEKAPGMNNKPHVVSCTKGTWDAKVSNIEKIFGPLPVAAKAEVKKLETMRLIRNRVGHAVGRDIDESQYHGMREIHGMEKINEASMYKFTTSCRNFANSLDGYLLSDHIGDFEVLRFFYSHHTDDTSKTLGDRVQKLKKAIGSKASPRGKNYLRDLLIYCDEL